MASTSEQPPTTPATRREVVFCHACHEEWYRDQHGIICPECDSDCTEIIEEGNDPRDFAMHGSEHDENDYDSLQSLEDASHNTHPLHNHNPWAHHDPDEADISTMRFQPMGPGRFHVSATIHRTISPAAFGQNGNGPNTIGGITSFLQNILQGAQNQQRGTDAPPEGHQQSEGEEGQGNARTGPVPDGQPHVHRFTYSAGARLHPRDDNNPPRLEPMDDINNVLSGLFAAFGPPGPPPGAREGGQDRGPAFVEMPINPLMGLLAAMSGGQHGDFVYSQEALDRIVSQLMEQTASSNAPGPAPQEAIDALPRRGVTEKMLGPEGRAECSICMDEVNIGEEVTELPCKHWFHHPCVSAWLHEHDTCPHCRKSIAPHDENTRGSGQAARSTPAGADPTLNMPGAFGATGDGTPEHPFILPGPSNANSSSNATQAQGGTNDGTGGSSSSEGFRSGWSGPQQ